MNRTCPSCHSEYSTVTPCVRCKRAVCVRCPEAKPYGDGELICGPCFKVLDAISVRFREQAK
jgi:hypothetical protein